MRFHGVLLLAANAALSSVNARAAGVTNMAKPNVLSEEYPLAAAEHDAPTKRMLRTDNPDDEDRVPGFVAKILSSTDKEMKGWLKSGNTADEVLSIMNQAGRTHSSLSDKGTVRLATYISKYNEMHGTEVTLLGTLTKAYRDEPVARMIQAEKRSSDPKIKALATQMENEQFDLWFRGERNSPLDIFKRLNLIKGRQEAMQGAAFRVLKGDSYEAGFRYLAYFNRQTGNDISEFHVLRRGYGNHGLALLIQSGKADHRVSNTALNMQRAQFKYWEDVLMVHPDSVYSDVFKLRRGVQPTDADDAIVAEYAYYLEIGAQLRANGRQPVGRRLLH